MKETPSLRQLIDSTQLLMENNEQLVKLNTDSFALFEEIYKKQEKMLVCFGKLYKFINSKNNKTWEEQDYVNELFDLITHSEIDEKDK